jgi:hypothetical protein
MAVCFLAALGIRLYDLMDLPLDFHPTRQLQSIVKTRGMYVNLQGLPDLQPWQRDFAIRQWQAMPTEEPEIVERLALWSYQLAGGEYLWIPRLYSILFWLIGGLALYALASDMTGRSGGVIAALFYLFLPYGIIASRTFMPDPLMVMFILLGLWAAWRWIKHPTWGWAVAAGLLCGLAVLVKLTAVFIITGGMSGLVIGEWGRNQVADEGMGKRPSAGMGLWNVFRNVQVWVVAALSLLPALFYNVVGIFVLKFIESGAVALRFHPNMLLQPVTYLMVNNLVNRVMGMTVLLLALAGSLLLADRRARALMIGLWGGTVAFGWVFIYYFATHDYYLLPLIPIVALGLAPLGQAVMDKLHAAWPRRWLPMVVALLLLLGAAGPMLEARNTLKRSDFRSEPAFWQALGDQLRSYRVIALSEDYNARLAYWGWLGSDYWLSSGDFTKREIAGDNINVQEYFDQQTAGKDVFLVTLLDELDSQPQLKKILYDHYPVLMQGERYIVFDLRHPR